MWWDTLKNAAERGGLAMAIQVCADECHYRASLIGVDVIMVDPNAAGRRNRLTAAKTALEALSKSLRGEQ